MIALFVCLFPLLDRLPDWTELFPLHKFSCEGDAEGVRRCLLLGMSADEKDTDGWASMHYACWSVNVDIYIER